MKNTTLYTGSNELASLQVFLFSCLMKKTTHNKIQYCKKVIFLNSTPNIIKKSVYSISSFRIIGVFKK